LKEGGRYEVNEKIYRLALVGKDVSTSDSERIHRFIFQAFGLRLDYERISVCPEEFDGVMVRLLGDFDGFNVTIPYKRDVMGYLNGVEGDALAFGAVNTVVCETRIGYNTDGVGFLQMLEGEEIPVAGKRALVLGAGGAGRSTAVALKNAGAKVFLYRRNREELLETCRELGVEAATKLVGFDMIVNATGVGMHGTIGISPVGKEVFQGAAVAIDLIYSPKQTEFLRLANEQGVKTVNGGAMLFYQAYYADCYYLKKQPTMAEAKALYTQYVAALEGDKE
jgi:shikimate dehydrogenase